MSVISTQNFGPFGPGIVRSPFCRRFGHHLQGGDRPASHADHGTDAVIAGISAADDYDMFSFCLHVSRKEAAAQYIFRGSGQEIDRKINACCPFHAFRLQGTGLFGTAAKNDRVIFFAQAGYLQILSDIDAGTEDNAFRLHQLLPSGDDALVQLHVGNSVHEQAADPVLPLINGNGMASPAESVRSGQAGRSAADYGNLPAAFPGRGFSFHPSLPVSRLDQIQLIIPDCNRIIVLPADASLFTEGRTDSSGKFRKTVGLHESGQGMPVLSPVDGVIPFGNQIVQRTAHHHATQFHGGLAEGHSAVHASGSLLPPDLR